MKLTKEKLREIIREEILNEVPDFSKPRINDYVRDGSMFGKVVHIGKVLGKNRVFIELQKPKSRGWMMYLVNNLKDTKKKNIGRVIWGTK